MNIISALAVAAIFATYPVSVRPVAPPPGASSNSLPPWALGVDAGLLKGRVKSSELLCSFHRYPVDAGDAFAASLRDEATRWVRLDDGSQSRVTVVIDHFEPALFWKQGVALFWAEPRAIVVVAGSITVRRDGRETVERFLIERTGGAAMTMNTCDAGSAALASALEAAEADMVAQLGRVLSAAVR